MNDEYTRAGVDEYDVQGTPPGDLGYPDRCPTCGGSKEVWADDPEDHYPCTDTFHEGGRMR